MYIDHVGINTNDMEATLQFYCGILGMQLVCTTRTPDGRRHYSVEIGGGNAFAVFDGAELPMAGERQHVRPRDGHPTNPRRRIVLPRDRHREDRLAKDRTRSNRFRADRPETSPAS